AKFLKATTVYRAPVTLRLARSKSLHVGALVNALANSVDPPVTKRLFHCFTIGNACLAGTLVVKAEPQFRDSVMILLQPRSKFSSRLENFNLHICSSGAHGTEYPLPLPLSVPLAVPLSPRIVVVIPSAARDPEFLLAH